MFLLVYAVTVTTLVLAVRRRTRSQLVIILVTLGVSIAAEQLFLRQMMGHPDSPLASHAAEFIEGTDWHDFSHLDNQANIPTGVCRTYGVAVVYSYQLCAYTILADARTGKRRFLLRMSPPAAFLSYVPPDAADRMIWDGEDVLWFDEDGQILSRAR